jgi:hypothetical protein
MGLMRFILPATGRFAPQKKRATKQVAPTDNCKLITNHCLTK